MLFADIEREMLRCGGSGSSSVRPSVLELTSSGVFPFTPDSVPLVSGFSDVVELCGFASVPPVSSCRCVAMNC